MDLNEKISSISEGLSYKEGILKVVNKYYSMEIPCSEDFVDKVISSIKKAKGISKAGIQHTAEEEILIDKLYCKNDKDSVMEAREREGYIKVGHFDGGTLFVGCNERIYDFCSFVYVSDRLPNRFGSTLVNIKVNFSKLLEMYLML